MSTNFYAYCKCCGAEGPHVGKRAVGGNVLLQGDSEKYTDWPSMQEWLLRRDAVVDEYGEVITPEEFIEMVEFGQQWPRPKLPEYRDADGYLFYDAEFS